MFANIITKLAPRAASSPSVNLQTVRFRKTFRLQTGYGIAPLYTTDQYLEAKEAGRLPELAFQDVRFATLTEADSPMHDAQYDRFCRYVAKYSQVPLGARLMRDTFYELKLIQYGRLKKLLAKQEKQQEATSADSSEPVEMNPMVLFKKAVRNCKPVVITKKVRRGGAIYQVPYPVDPNYSEYLSFKWLIEAVRERPKPRKKNFPVVMAQEILDAAENRGKVIKKRDDIHKLADANKAYAHYRWG